MRIALLSLQKDTQRAPPIGLVYLATYLRDSCGIRGEDILVLDNYYTKDMKREIQKFHPDVVGFTSMSVNYSTTVSFAKELREVTGPIPYLIGGVHISTLPQSFDPVFDIGILGEGEETLRDILSNPGDPYSTRSILYWKGGEMQWTERRAPIQDIDQLPIPDFSFVDRRFFEPEEIPAACDVGVKGYVLSSRGCPYRCVFCSTARFWGKMRFHSPEYTARLFKRMSDQFGADYLWTLDDLFTVNAKRVREIREALEKLGVFSKIKGTVCNVRANLVTEELCRELVKTKVVMVNFGFETGSDRVLKQLKAGSVSVDQNKKALLMCRDFGITVYGSLMYGVPGETLEDMRQTNQFIDFAKANGARNIWSFVASPYPMTSFWDAALAKGKVSPTMDFSKLGCHSPEEALLLDSDIDRVEFVKVFKEGRRKLRSLKVRLILRFLCSRPLLFLRLMLREPAHYIKEPLKWLIKQ